MKEWERFYFKCISECISCRVAITAKCVSVFFPIYAAIKLLFGQSGLRINRWETPSSVENPANTKQEAVPGSQQGIGDHFKQWLNKEGCSSTCSDDNNKNKQIILYTHIVRRHTKNKHKYNMYMNMNTTHMSNNTCWCFLGGEYKNQTTYCSTISSNIQYIPKRWMKLTKQVHAYLCMCKPLGT